MIGQAVAQSYSNQVYRKSIPKIGEHQPFVPLDPGNTRWPTLGSPSCTTAPYVS
jgi:hypothetical protein